MKTIRITMVIAAIALAWSLSAKQETVSTNCVKVADIKVGNKANSASEEVVLSKLMAEAKQIGADKVDVKMIRNDHGKLGARYYAKAVALKCDN